MTRTDERRTHPERTILMFFLVLMVAFSASARNPITLSVVTDKTTYNSGDTIQVSVLAVYGDGSPVIVTKKSEIEIKDGAGRRQTRDTLANNGDGNFSYGHTIGSDANEGSWQIKVKIEDLGSARRGRPLFLSAISYRK